MSILWPLVSTILSALLWLSAFKHVDEDNLVFSIMLAMVSIGLWIGWILQ